VRGALKADIAAVCADLALVEHRLLTRLGGVVVVTVGVLFAALHYWPPPGAGSAHSPQLREGGRCHRASASRSFAPRL
jgi:hypothetical protein